MKVDLQKALAKKVMVLNHLHSDEVPEVNDMWKATVIDNAQYIPFVKIKGTDGIVMSADEKQAHIPLDSNFVKSDEWAGSDMHYVNPDMTDTIARRFQKIDKRESSLHGFYGMYWQLLSGDGVDVWPSDGWSAGYSSKYPNWYNNSSTPVSSTEMLTPGSYISDQLYLVQDNGTRLNVQFSVVVDSDSEFLTLITYKKNTSPILRKFIANSHIVSSIYRKSADNFRYQYQSGGSLVLSNETKLLPANYPSLLGDSWTLGKDDYIVLLPDDFSGDITGFTTPEDLKAFLEGKDFFKAADIQIHRNDGLMLPDDASDRNFPLLYANEVFVKGSGNSMR